MAQKPKSSSRNRHSKGSKAPVTIDLDAKDVKETKSSSKGKSTKAAKTASAPPRKSVPRSGGSSGAGPSTPLAEKTQVPKTSDDGDKTRSLKSLSDSTDKATETASKSSAATKTEKTTTPSSNDPAKQAPVSSAATSQNPERKNNSGSTLLAACIGGVIALGLAGLLQYAGILGAPGTSSDAEATLLLENRIVGLEKKLASQSAAPTGEEIASLVDARLTAQSASSADRIAAAEGAVQQMQERLAALDDGASPDAMLTARLDQLAKDVAALKSSRSNTTVASGDGASIAQLDKLSEDIESVLNDQVAKIEAVGDTLNEASTERASIRERLSETVQRLDAIGKEQSETSVAVAALRDRTENGADKRAATAIAAAALKGDIDSGQPFAASLNNLKAFAADNTGLNSLESFAETGVPTVAQLTAGFEDTVSKAILDAAAPKEEGGIASRLAAGARALVEVKPIGVIEGDTPAARVSQILGALKGNDLSRASSVWEQLPEAGQQASRDWHNSLQARLTANTVVSGAIEDILNSSRGG